ncbi:MAG: hypothetical protein HYZ84_05600 [Candidatus Omnitrophica bacterium]|nr:hypothetical protein [Candidatus Omnitrophota bacterium]
MKDLQQALRTIVRDGEEEEPGDILISPTAVSSARQLIARIDQIEILALGAAKDGAAKSELRMDETLFKDLVKTANEWFSKNPVARGRHYKVAEPGPDDPGVEAYQIVWLERTLALAPSLVASKLVGTEFFKTQLTIYIPQSVSTPQNFFDIVIAMLETEAAKTVFYGRPESYARWDNSEKQGLVSALNETILGRSQPIPLRSELRASELMVNMVIKAVLQPVRKDPQAEPEIPAITRTGLIDLLSQIIEGHPVSDAVTVNRINHVLRKVRLHPGDRRILGEIKESLVHLYDDKRWQGFVGAARSEARVDGDFNDLGWVVEQTNTYRDRLSETSQETLPGFLKELLDFQNDLFRHWKSKDRPQQVEEILGRLSDYWTAATERLQSRQEPLVKEVHEQEENNLFAPLNDDALALRAINTHFGMSLVTPLQQLTEIKRHLEKFNELLQSAFPRHSREFQAAYIKALQTIAGAASRPTVSYRQLIDSRTTVGDYIDAADKVTSRNRVPTEKLGRQLQHWGGLLSTDYNQTLHQLLPDINLLHSPRSEVEPHIIIGLVDEQQRLYSTTAQSGTFRDESEPEHVLQFPTLYETLTKIPPTWRILLLPQRISQEHVSPKDVRVLRRAALQIENLTVGVRDALTKQTFDEWKKGTPEYDQELLRIREDQLDRGYPAATSLALQMARQVLHDLNWQPTPGQRWLFIEPNSAGLPHFFALHQQDVTVVSSNRDVQELFDSREITGWLQAEGSPVKLLRGSLRQDNIAAVLGQEKKFDYVVIYASDRGNLKELIFRTQDWKQPTNGGWYAGIIGGESPEEVEQTRREVEQVFQVPGQNAAKSVKMEKAIAPGASFADRFGLIILNRSELRDAVGLDVSLAKGLNITKNRRGRLRKIQKALGAKIRLAKTDKGRHQLMNEKKDGLQAWLLPHINLDHRLTAKTDLWDSSPAALKKHKVLNKIIRLARKARNQGVTDWVHVGVGGSIASAQALVSPVIGTNHNDLSDVQRKGRPRAHWVGDNYDPVKLRDVLRGLEGRGTLFTTIFHDVSKSGTTGEPFTAYMFIRNWLETRLHEIRTLYDQGKIRDGKFGLEKLGLTKKDITPISSYHNGRPRYPTGRFFIVSTGLPLTDNFEVDDKLLARLDAGKASKAEIDGLQSEFLKQHYTETDTRNIDPFFGVLPVPEGMGGRFSTFSAVGLMTAAAVVPALGHEREYVHTTIRAASEAMKKYLVDFKADDPRNTPFLTALAFYLWGSPTGSRPARGSLQLMDFAPQTFDVASLMQELWNESVVENNQGPHLQMNLGTNQNHMNLQGIFGNPKGHIGWFFRTAVAPEDDFQLTPGVAISRSLKGFEEQKQGDIQMDSAVGTAKEFSKFDIPVISWDLQGRTAYDIAHLIATLQLTVAVFGDLRNLGAQTYLQQHVVGYKEQTRKEMAKRETKPFNEAGVPTGPTESINILLNAAALSEMRSSTSSKEEEFLEDASARILAAFHDSNSAEALNRLFPILIQQAKAIGNPGLISRALRRAFDSFGEDDKKQREFTGALGMAMTKNSAELGDDFQSQAFPPRVLQGRGTVWTIATSPTIDIDAQKKLLEWEDPKSLLMGPGGGGINVAIALARLGLRARPLFFYAGKTGEQLIRLIKNQGVYVGDAVEVDVDDQTRVTMVINPHDKTENLVPKGIPVTPLAQQQLIGKLLDEETGVQKGDIVVISGSLAPGLSDRFYADLGQKLRVRGAVVIIDTKGPAAKEVLFPTTSDGPAAATIVSMNQFEFGELVGVGPQDIPKLTRKAREIIESRPPDQAIQEIIITLGPKGAFSVTRDRVWEAPAPQVENVESEVGAGDWSLAQRVFEAWSETEPVNGFIRGVAAGTASVQHPGTGGGTPAEVDHFTKKIPVTEHVLVEKPYPRGEVPTAELVQANRLTAAVTSSLAAAAFAKGLIGYYHRLIAEGVPSNLALQFAQIELDAIGQDIFTEVHDLLGIDVRFHGYEGRKKKGMGALKAGPRLGILGAKEEVWGVVDVFDGSELIVRGEADPGGSGGSSIYLIGPLVKAFGPMPDQLGAGLVIFGVPHKDQMKSFYDKPLDPDAPVTETLHRAASANEVTFNELDVYLMDRSRLEAEYRKPLKDLQKAYPGLRIIEVHHGSHDEALRAVLGQENGRVPVFLGTAGSTEAVADYLIALLFDTVAVGLRIYGDYSKTIGDAAGTLARTLAELDKDQLAKARKVVPELDRLPHNIPIRYLFSRGIQTELRKLNRRDTKAILSPTGRFFHNQSIKFPRTSTDTPSIALFDDQGGAIALVPGIKHDDPILSAATSFVLPSRILEMPAVRERFPGHIEVPTLHIERVDGKTYDWVDYRNVSRQDLANLLPDQFPPPAVSSSEMRHVASLQPQVIRGNRPSRLFVTQLAGVLRPRGNRIQTRNIAPRKQRQLATRLIRITPDNIAQFAEMLRSYVSTAPLGLADVQDVDAESIRATYEAESGHIIDLIVAALQKSPDTKVDLALEVLKGDDITSASEAISHFSAWLQRLLLTGDGTDQAGSIKNKTGAGVTTTRNLDRYVPDTAVQGILPLIQLNDRGYQGRNESVLAIGSNSQGINAANALHHYAQKYGNFVETGIAIASALSGESRTQIIQRLTNRKFDGLDNRVVNLLKAVLLDQFSADSGQQVFSFSTNGVVVNVMALAAYLSYQSELRFKASA